MRVRGIRVRRFTSVVVHVEFLDVQDLNTNITGKLDVRLGRRREVARLGLQLGHFHEFPNRVAERVSSHNDYIGVAVAAEVMSQDLVDRVVGWHHVLEVVRRTGQGPIRQRRHVVRLRLWRKRTPQNAKVGA